jgi:hypothetical protein
MSLTLDQAAAELLRTINAPAGAVNTVGAVEKRKKIIRVLVDPNYWYRLGEVPKTFSGYGVKVERRGDISTGHFVSHAAT